MPSKDITELFTANPKASSRGGYERMGPTHQEVLNYFRSIFPNGATDKELEAHFGSAKSNRRRELCQMGFLQDSGRSKKEGRYRSVIWVASPWESANAAAN